MKIAVFYMALFSMALAHASTASFTVGGSSTVVINMPESQTYWLAVIPFTETPLEVPGAEEDDEEEIPCPSVDVSTGPVILRPSLTSANCYRFKGVQENGTPIPTRGEWVKCP